MTACHVPGPCLVRAALYEFPVLSGRWWRLLLGASQVPPRFVLQGKSFIIGR